ncbi:hypothetical protein ACIPYQ_17385 [Streptomyces sp. NPDC090045]|uniref:hypothetical protein n=1 Tax=Streptomyces sp. NPDC090045 TaxID=3365927 RepID=UPI003821BC30
MSTPEEHQHQQQREQREQQEQHEQHELRRQQYAQHQDPYGTQTWQSDTWDTSHQPVYPALGAVPGQPAAPEGWFRDEAPAAQPPAQPQAPAGGAGASWPDGSVAGSADSYAASYEYPAAGGPAQQPVAPEGWFRDEVPAQAPAPAPVQDWSQGGQGAGMPASAAEQTAYMPPYPGPEQFQAPAEQSAYLPPYPAQAQQPVAPDGWFRDEVPAQAPAPAQDWSQGGQGVEMPASAAEQTAYMPPYPGPEQSQAPADETAYLPPVPGAAQSSAPADETAYLPPVPAPAQDGAAAEQTAYLPPQAAAAPAEDGAEAVEVTAWSPPTLAGNTVRAVDPAQARAEGRSPIIDPGPQSAILTAALGLLLAVAAALGQYALLVPLIALQGLTAAGWFRLNGMWPARQGIALAFAGALVADVAVLAVDRTYGPGAIVGTLGAWVLITLFLQLRSRAEPDERMYGLMASVASAALAIVCAGYLAAGSAAVTVGAAAVAVAVFARALPLPTAPSVGVSLAAAAGAGIAVGGMTSVGVGGALLGLVCGVCALIGLRVAAYDYPSKFVHMTAGVAMPLAAAAPAVYLIGRVVG